MKLSYEVRRKSDNVMCEVGKIKVLDFAIISENDKLLSDSRMVVLYKNILPYKAISMNELLMIIFDKAYNFIKKF